MLLMAAASHKIRILLADDHSIVRSGVRSLLSRQPDMTVVGEVETAEQMLEALDKEKPEVIVLDLKMPGGGTIDAIKRVRERARGPLIVVFTGYDDSTDAILSLRAGAAAYVLKRSPETELLEAIRRVKAGGLHIDQALGPAMTERILDLANEQDPPPSSPLSRREAQVLELTAMGYTNRQMADRLEVSIKSVETYRHRIAEKLGLRSRAEFTRYVFHSGILEREPSLPPKS